MSASPAHRTDGFSQRGVDRDAPDRGGAVIAILGPDGSGKSSVIDALIANGTTSGTGFLRMHFRPGIGRDGDDGEVVTDPHGQRLRGAIASSLKLIYYLLDYRIGFWTKVRPSVRKGRTVLFDRYYHDVLVDPLRYRYGGPKALAHLVARLVPEVDVSIILDAEPQVILDRKAEVQLDELQRLRTAYRAVATTLLRCHVVDSSRPLADVVADIERIIADHVLHDRRVGRGSASEHYHSGHGVAG